MLLLVWYIDSAMIKDDGFMYSTTSNDLTKLNIQIIKNSQEIEYLSPNCLLRAMLLVWKYIEGLRAFCTLLRGDWMMILL